MPHAMHQHTPVLKVLDGRGQITRRVSWHRAKLDEPAQERVEQTRYDAGARTTSTWDPRLFKRLETVPVTGPNLVSFYSLSGRPLATESVDSGWEVSLCAEGGNLAERWDSRHSHWITDYDEFLRPIAVHEQTEDQAWRTRERFQYADNSEEAAQHNLCGLLALCFDGAGSQQTHACGVLGQTLGETRRFLQSPELPDWPTDPAQREQLLEPGNGASTSFTHDATGLLLEQVDAVGNRQSHTYGKSGNLQTVGLAAASGESHSLLHSLTYNAFAQIESQTAGNGVTSLARFDPADGRLQELLARKAGTELIQHLKYSYDPAGNVIEVEDRAQPIRYFANQRVVPVSYYEYDSLYQLIKATGREIAGSPIQPELPDLKLIPIDANLFSNYTQRFSYDEAGNLLELRHEGSHAHTRRMAIDPGSNRALPLAANDGPPDFNTQFDANGNLQVLAPGRPLRWTPCNQLLETVSLTRASGDNDSERYAYDVHGIRLRKTATARTRSLVLTHDVRYLPGLEIHVDSGTGEQLEVIDLQAGRTRIRHLHWVESKPPGIPDNQIRYSVSDHLGSAALELDSEARMISHEGYYPFGGTAWWAGRSAVEANYKTIRYSGKERDASGLYYYGLRYYAPWLQRWINPDPGEQPVDLNRYRMVGNGPVSQVDLLGLEGFDFNIPGVVVAIAGLLAGLVLFLRKRRPAEQPTEPITQQAEVDAIDTDMARWKERFGLNDEEVSRVHALKADLPKGTKLGLHQSGSGLIRAFMLTTKLHLSVFNKYSMAKKFPKSEIQSARLFYTEIRPARERAPSPVLQALQNVTSDSESPMIKSRKTTTKQRTRGFQTSESDASSYLSSAPSSRRGSVVKYQVDIGDFFDSKEFKRAVKKFPDEDVEMVLKMAITKLKEQSGGSPHVLSTGQLSVDVKLGQGQSSGRGKFRLLFNPTDRGSWRPWGVADTHK